MTNTVATKTRRPSKKAVAKAVAPILAMMPSLPLLTHQPELVPFTADEIAIPGENPVTFTDAEFEELMAAHLEDSTLVLDPAGSEEDLPPAGPEAIEPDLRDFATRLAEVTPEQKETMLWDVAGRIDDRLSRADGKAVKNLERARRKMVTGRVSLAICAAGRDASFVNRSWFEGKEFNVYGLLKLADIAAGLTGGAITNAVNVAVIKSMFALEKAGIPYDFDTAKAAASSSHAPQRAGVRQHLTRHTVAAGTASTQAGSTMHALMALGVVHFVASKNPTYAILENATTEALRNAKFEAGEEE